MQNAFCDCMISSLDFAAFSYFIIITCGPQLDGSYLLNRSHKYWSAEINIVVEIISYGFL